MKNKKNINDQSEYISYLENEIKRLNYLLSTKDNSKTELNKALKPYKHNNKIKLGSKLVSVENITKKFGENVVLKDVNFDIYEGETLALVGANGAGKTVLMEILVGLMSPNNGKINFNFPDNLNYKKEIGMQFQDNEIKGKLKAKDLVRFYMNAYKEKNITSIEINELKKVFGVEEFWNKKISKLSGGQRQRVNLLLAVMSKPKLLILDEFITGLDITSVINILEYIQKQKEETKATLIIISHQPEEIKMLATRILVLKKGVITQETTVKEALSKNNGNMTDFLRKAIT